MEDDYRKTHGVLLDKEIPILQLPIKGAREVLETAIRATHQDRWTHPQVAVPRKTFDLTALGFKPTRFAVPLPGEKTWTTSWRSGRLHAHAVGPFFLVHEDNDAPTGVRGWLRHTAKDTPQAVMARYFGGAPLPVIQKSASKLPAELKGVQKGDVLLVSIDKTTGNNPVQKIFDWGTQRQQGNLTHAAMYMGDGKVLDTRVGDGVTIKPFNHAKLRNKTIKVYRPKVSAKHREAAVDFAKQQVGKEYDTPSLVAAAVGTFVPRKLTEAVDRFSPGAGKDPGKWTCSNLIDAAYGKANLTGKLHGLSVPADFRTSRKLRPIKTIVRGSLEATKATGGRVAAAFERTKTGAAKHEDLTLHKDVATSAVRGGLAGLAGGAIASPLLTAGKATTLADMGKAVGWGGAKGAVGGAALGALYDVGKRHGRALQQEMHKAQGIKSNTQQSDIDRKAGEVAAKVLGKSPLSAAARGAGVGSVLGGGLFLAKGHGLKGLARGAGFGALKGGLAGGGLGAISDMGRSAGKKEERIKLLELRAQSKDATAITPAIIHALADSRGVKWDNDPTFMAKCRKWVGKSHLDTMTQTELGEVADQLQKSASSPAELYALSKVTQKKMLPVLLREKERLEKAFPGHAFEPFSSVHSGINLPGEGASDIDLNVGVEDPEAFSKVLSKAGIPLFDTKKNATQQILHQYQTPEGYDVEIKVRPTHEIAYQIPGRARIVGLSDAQKMRIVAEKHRLKELGDEQAYKNYKYSIYEKYKMIPPGGDWSTVKKADEPVSKEKRQALTGVNRFHAESGPGKWDTFIGKASRKSFVHSLVNDPRADDKLKVHADRMNRLITGTPLDVVDGGTGRYVITRLRGGNELGCTCEDWRYKRSVAGLGDTDCKHIAEWKAKKSP